MAGPPHGGIQVDAARAACCLALESVDIGHAPRRSGADAAKAEFSEQGPLVDFLEKSGAHGVGDLKDGTQHTLGQPIQLIGVPRRSSAAKLTCRPDAKALDNNSSAADKRRSTPIFGRNRGTRPVQLIPGRCTSVGAARQIRRAWAPFQSAAAYRRNQ